MTDNPAKDAERLADLPPIKTEREQAMRETIHGQGLSMVAMGNELREKDATIARLTQERDEARRSAEAMEADRDKLGKALVRIALMNGQSTKKSVIASEALQWSQVDVLENLRGKTAQPTPDDVERAREIFTAHIRNGCVVAPDFVEHIADALTAARREGAELRALDEAAFRKRILLEAFEETMPRDGEAWSRDWHDAANLIRARISDLAARDAAIRAREGEE